MNTITMEMSSNQTSYFFMQIQMKQTPEEAEGECVKMFMI